MIGQLVATLFALLFAIPFGVAGAFGGYGIYALVGGSVRANDWVLVQAKVDSVELERHSGRKGGVTYHASGAYRYTVAGKEYVNDKLSFMPYASSDKIGGWQQDMAALLRDAKESGKTLPVYVNPDDPADSVVDRGIRWSMVLLMGVFAVLFGGASVGALGALAATWFGGGDAPRGRKRDRKRAKEEAATGAGNAASIESGAGSSVIGLWILTVLWNAIAWPIALLTLPDRVGDGEWLGLFVLIFPLAGLLLFGWCVVQTIGLWRRGASSLALSGKQPRMGGRLSGTVRYERGEPGKDFEVRLIATQRKREGHSTSVVPRWWRDLKARSTPDADGGLRIPFQFDIPSRVEAPDLTPGDEPVALQWSVQVKPRGAANPTDSFDIVLQGSKRPATDDRVAAGSPIVAGEG